MRDKLRTLIRAIANNKPYQASEAYNTILKAKARRAVEREKLNLKKTLFSEKK